MAYNPTYHFQQDIPRITTPMNALRSDPIRHHKSEYLDDIKFQCGGLRNIANQIENAAVKLDNDRRSGKAWDSGSIMCELRKAYNILMRLNQTAERMSE